MFSSTHQLYHFDIFSVTTALYGSQHNFGQGTGPVFLYGVGCSGSESSLLSCSHSGISFNWCSHSADAGVVCPCRLDVYSWLLDAQGINDDCIPTQLIYALISNSLGYFKNRYEAKPDTFQHFMCYFPVKYFLHKYTHIIHRVSILQQNRKYQTELVYFIHRVLILVDFIVHATRYSWYSPAD